MPRSYEAKDRFGGLAEATFSIRLGRVGFYFRNAFANGSLCLVTHKMRAQRHCYWIQFSSAQITCRFIGRKFGVHRNKSM